MGADIDVYVSLISPWTWMGHARLVAIAGTAGRRIVIHPVNGGTLFERTGGLPLARRSAQRQAYRMQELKRWRRRLEMPLVLEPKYFPADETAAAHLVIAAREAGADAVDLAGRFLRGVWEQERNIADPATVDMIVAEAGLVAAELRAAAERIDAVAMRTRETETAIARGVFGMPTVVIGEDLFWGQDRLDFVAEALGVTV